MKPLWHRALEPDFPRSTRLQSTSWVTWFWIAMATLALVVLAMGLVFATAPELMRP